MNPWLLIRLGTGDSSSLHNAAGSLTVPQLHYTLTNLASLDWLCNFSESAQGGDLLYQRTLYLSTSEVGEDQGPDVSSEDKILLLMIK